MAQIFDDASLLRMVEQRVDYALWSNRRVTPFVRRWFDQRVRKRGCFGRHPMNRDEAVHYLCELLKRGTKTRDEMWQFVNTELGKMYRQSLSGSP